MKYLKDIPDIYSHPNIEYLEESNLWEMPLRFISPCVLEGFFADMVGKLSIEESESLQTHVVACTTMAQFLGMCCGTQLTQILSPGSK